MAEENNTHHRSRRKSLRNQGHEYTHKRHSHSDSGHAHHGHMEHRHSSRGEGRPGEKYPGSGGGSRGKGWVPTLIAAVVIITVVIIYMIVRSYAERKEAEMGASNWRDDYVYLEETESESSGREYIAAEIHDVIEYEGATYRRNNYVKAILLLGIDRDDELSGTTVAGSGGQSDAIFLVAWDSARNKARLLMIPRDTITDIPMTDLSGNFLAWGTNSINLAYAYGDGREKSVEFATGAVTKLLCGLSIDGCVAFSRGAIPILNDGVGGVTVTVETDALEDVDPVFKEGSTITLMGDKATAYVRYRDITVDNSAIFRMQRHRSYIEAFTKAAVEAVGKDDTLIPTLMDAVEPYMYTDMYKSDYLSLALAMAGTGSSLANEDMITLPGETFTGGTFDEFYADEEQKTSIVLDLFYRQID